MLSKKHRKDFVSQGIPIVGSEEIDWLCSWYQATPTDYLNISEKLEFAYRYRMWNFQYFNKLGLSSHNKKSEKAWLEFLKEDC